MATEPGPLSDGTAAFPYAEPAQLPSGERRWENMVYAAEAGYRPLFLDLRVPPTTEGQKHPVVVWIHGGGWVFGSRRRQAPNIHAYKTIERIVDAGFAVALIDYRFLLEAPFPAQLLDIKAAIRWLRGHADEFDIDPSRIAAWGESAGAHLASMIGMCDRISDEQVVGEFREQSDSVGSVVEWYGPAEFTSWAPAVRSQAAPSEERGNTELDVLSALIDASGWTPAELSPVSYARADVPPIFIAHGRQDRQVNVEQSRILHRALLDAGATVEYLETDGDHVFTDADTMPQVIEASLNFLKQQL